MLWHSHTLYSCHHTQDTCHRIQCFWALTYSLMNIAHLQYVVSQTHCMYDIIWILCDITTALYDLTRLYSWHHIHTLHDITPTVYNMTYILCVTSQPLLLWQDTYYVLTLHSVNVTSQTVNEWQHNDCIWHDTHCISVIKPIWLMTSQTMYVWNHTYCIYDTTGILCDITSTIADNTPLFVCHGTHSVYEILCIINVVTHIVCMTTQALYLAWNPLKLPSLPLCM